MKFSSNFRLPTSDLAIAVSGGADSMALLHMLATQKQAKQKLVALTVDHGLRTDSLAEAKAVAAYCQTLHVEHHILTWNSDKPLSGVQNKARNARRQLLLDKCKDLGITDLFLAHQADDQVETMLQRLSRGSGPNGLIGMRPQTKQQGITLHRPLLKLRRLDLRTYCLEHKIPFHDDPSNVDLKFERIQWRAFVAQVEQTQPHFVQGLLRSQNRFETAAHAISQQAKDWLDLHAARQGDKIILPLAELKTQSLAVIVEIIRQLMTTKKAYQVDLQRLEDWVEQAFNHTPVENALTLGQWWLQIKKEALTIQPAPQRRS